MGNEKRVQLGLDGLRNEITRAFTQQIRQRVG